MPTLAIVVGSVPCRHNHGAMATAVFFLPRSCPCFNDPVQALCDQHRVKLANNGYPMIKLVDLDADAQ